MMLARLGVGIVVFALLVIGAGVMIAWQVRVVARERAAAVRTRAAAVRERARAEAALGFLRQMLASEDPDERGPSVTLREVLDEAVVKLDEVSDGDPVVAAELHRAIGKAYEGLGLLDESVHHLSKVLSLWRASGEADSAALARGCGDLGRVLYRNGELEEAEALLTEALALTEAGEGEASQLAALAKVDLAELLESSDRWEEAERLLDEALAALREDEGPADEHVARVLRRLARVAAHRGDHERAVVLLEETLEIHRKRLRPEDPQLIHALLDLAAAYRSVGREGEAEALYDEAEASLRKGRAVAGRTLGPRHPRTLALSGDLARLLIVRGEADAGLEILRDIVVAYSDLVSDGDGGNRRDKVGLAGAKDGLAEALMAVGRLSEAEVELRGALELRRGLYGPVQPEVARSLERLAALARRQGDVEGAMRLSAEAEEMRQGGNGEE
jgi:tetratricopeptide (TPR) repeat protein